MEKSIEKSVDTFLRKERTEKDTSDLLLACSGGVDSMVLAHILVKLGYHLALAHCNFKLRGTSSDLDQEFVENWAKSRRLKCFVKSFDTETYANEKGVSIQMAARDLRYTYFRELLQQHNFDNLLTAQHADDSLETILINLGRGSGLSSMAGIRPVHQKNILRPLWQHHKEEILTYAQKHGLDWREDESNSKDDYQRNFIRLHVVPSLKKAFPNFESSFAKSLSRSHEDRQLMEELISEKLEKAVSYEGNTEKLSLKALSNLKSLAALLHFWLKDKGKFDVEAIHNSLQSESGRQFESESHSLLLNRGKLILKPKNQTSEVEYHINKSDEAITEPINLKIKIIDQKDYIIRKNPTEAVLDFDKLCFPLTLRTWKPGDSFVPLGMKGTKKLSDFFIDEKMSLYEKDKTLLLCSGESIVWIVGKRIDDRFKVTDKTKTVYFVRLL